jgi:hypothetical protein
MSLSESTRKATKGVLVPTLLQYCHYTRFAGHPLNTWLYKAPTGSGAKPKDKLSRPGFKGLFSRKKISTEAVASEESLGQSSSGPNHQSQSETY